jgi:hypothetical protein
MSTATPSRFACPHCDQRPPTQKAIPAGKMIRCPKETMPVRLGRALLLASLLLAPGCSDDGVDWKGVGTDSQAKDSTAPAADSQRSETHGRK